MARVNTTVKTQSVQAVSWGYMLMLSSNCREEKKCDEILMCWLPGSEKLGMKDPI